MSSSSTVGTSTYSGILDFYSHQVIWHVRTEMLLLLYEDSWAQTFVSFFFGGPVAEGFLDTAFELFWEAFVVALFFTFIEGFVAADLFFAGIKLI